MAGAADQLSTSHRTIVVGSGPAGVAAARALVVRGVPVTMLDVGFTGPDPASEPERPPPGRFGRKLAAGSDHPYRPPRGRAPATNDTALVASHARGGFSTVWGATMLPFDDEDLSGWPLARADLDAAYREVMAYVPVAASADALARRHPLLGTEAPALRGTTAAQTVLDRLAGRAACLDRHGVTVGRARLAVRSHRPAPAAGCVYCRRCLGGCPYDHIWSAGHTLTELLARPGFTYRPGLYVERVVEQPDAVAVGCRNLATGAAEELRADRLLLAAGAVGTTTLLQRSGLIPAHRTILDSGLTVVPAVLLARPGPAGEAAHTLSQLFAHLEGGPDQPPAAVQIYGPDPAVAERARCLRPGLTRLAGPLLEPALRPLLMAFVYLHSDLSDAITCRTAGDATHLSRVANPARQAAAEEVIARFRRAVAPAGLLPLGRLRADLPVGQGFHAGGSIPMRHRPNRGTTDLFGRPWGLHRIHAVDASVFPTIPAGPLTWSIMANATRIARELAGSTPPTGAGPASPSPLHRVGP